MAQNPKVMDLIAGYQMLIFSNKIVVGINSQYTILKFRRQVRPVDVDNIQRVFLMGAQAITKAVREEEIRRGEIAEPIDISPEPESGEVSGGTNGGVREDGG